MHVLVTGAAGFIGFHLSKRLIAEGHTVVGIDNLNDYYSVQLKKDRLAQLRALPGFTFEHTDLADDAALEAVFGRNTFSHVVNLAAQAGVRYSLINPKATSSPTSWASATCSNAAATGKWGIWCSPRPVPCTA